MKEVCKKCGSPLRAFVALRYTCKTCGEKYRAARRRTWATSLLSGIHALSIVLYIPFLLWSPFNKWVNFGFVPIVYVLTGLLISMKSSTWERNSSTKGLGP
jgi:uncharacterized protein (DUF983 family)